MQNAQAGDTVLIDYVVRKSDGEVVANTEEQGPQTIKLGEGAIFPQIEERLTSMDLGETQTVEISCDHAFGPRNDEMIIDIPRENLPPEMEPQQGMALQAEQQDGQRVTLYVVSVSDDVVKADGNHPLAGEDLDFDVTLREIRRVA
jgi:FKBP-type peptidyl-prolyl cis-trans isomerase 2